MKKQKSTPALAKILIVVFGLMLLGGLVLSLLVAGVVFAADSSQVWSRLRPSTGVEVMVETDSAEGMQAFGFSEGFIFPDALTPPGMVSLAAVDAALEQAVADGVLSRSEADALRVAMVEGQIEHGQLHRFESLVPHSGPMPFMGMMGGGVFAALFQAVEEGVLTEDEMMFILQDFSAIVGEGFEAQIDPDTGGFGPGRGMKFFFQGSDLDLKAAFSQALDSAVARGDISAGESESILEGVSDNALNPFSGDFMMPDSFGSGGFRLGPDRDFDFHRDFDSEFDGFFDGDTGGDLDDESWQQFHEQLDSLLQDGSLSPEELQGLMESWQE